MFIGETRIKSRRILRRSRFLRFCGGNTIRLFFGKFCFAKKILHISRIRSMFRMTVSGCAEDGRNHIENLIIYKRKCALFVGGDVLDAPYKQENLIIKTIIDILTDSHIFLYSNLFFFGASRTSPPTNIVYFHLKRVKIPVRTRLPHIFIQVESFCGASKNPVLATERKRSSFSKKRQAASSRSRNPRKAPFKHF